MNDSFDAMESHLEEAIERSAGMPERLWHLDKALSAVRRMRDASERGELTEKLRSALLYEIIARSADSGAFREEANCE